jgi:putative restriction endonuclease
VGIDVRQVLAGLPARHRAALMWFADRQGSTHGWPAPIQTSDGETLLASKAKGIYKPGWSQYALSVRQNLAGTYPDREPTFLPDGTWTYSYFQENDEPLTRDDEYTNRGLMRCLEDCVPIGVMRQIRPKPGTRYAILGLALVSRWDRGYFLLEGCAKKG